ncbi:MAG: major facilitator superfamily 1 [Candidatus Acidoferrum typicum]|nr:major facilitator superfamily 1 [Candidatus Acidoferrum typicum]
MGKPDIVPPRMSTATLNAPNSGEVQLNRNQIRGFWAAWGGWALDGMDSFIYALVLVPSLRDLLPRSGIPATKGNIGFYGGLLFALFLVGWGLAFLWGPIGDKFGRVRTLMITIVWYSVFTFLSAVVTTVSQLAILRLLAGIGIGGEWAMGGTFVAEEWPEDRRRAGAGYMHTGYYVGIFLAAIANYAIGTRFGHNGWRVMFAVGGLPALLLAWVRHGVKEPSRWKKKVTIVSSWQIWRPFAVLFSKSLRRRTILNTLFMLASISGLWAGTVYVPSAVTALAEAAGRVGPAAAQLASRATMLVAFATILGCLLMPWLAERLGRRGALASYFALMLIFVVLTFGKVFYMGPSALPLFFVCLFFLGFGGANFAVYTLWLPEQYPTECRASAFAFSTSFARFGGAAITFLVGAGVQHYGSLGIPVALTALAFAVGLLLIPFGVETRGQALPA